MRSRISWSARQNETFVAISTLGSSAFIDFQPDARMAKRCSAGNIRRSIASNATQFDDLGFGKWSHAPPIASEMALRNLRH